MPRSRAILWSIITWPIRLSVIFFVTVEQAHGQDPPYRAFTVADGLPSNTVYGCTQDYKGLLWFATDAGAARFDGDRFEVFTTANGLLDNEVLQIFHDKEGRTWFLSLNGKLCFLEQGHFHDARDRPELANIRPASGFASVAESPQGTVWFGGHSGPLYAWKAGRSWTVLPEAGCPGSPIEIGIPLLIHVPGQEPWLVLNTSLYRFTGQVAHFVRCWEASVDGYPVASANRNELLAIGDVGLVRSNGVNDVLLRDAGTLPPPRTLRTPYLSRNNEIWIPSNRNGIIVMDSTGGNHRSILNGTNVHSVFQDNEGNMWLSTNGLGAIRIDPWQKNIRIYHEHRNVTAVLATHNGDVLFGTDDGAIDLLRDGRITSVLAPGPHLDNNERIRDLQEDVSGRIWFSTDHRVGQIRMEGSLTNVTECWYLDERTPIYGIHHSFGLKALATGRNGHVVGSFFGIAELKDTLGHPTFIARRRYWSAEQRMYAPFIDADGSVWFETCDELHCYRNGERIDFPSLRGHCGSRITDIDQLTDGTMVIGTAGNGVIFLRNDRLVHRIGRSEGMPGDQVRAAVVRGNEVLVATDAGACSISDPCGRARIRTWGESEGLAGLDIKDIDRDSTMLYMATPSGLIVFPFATPPLARPAPRISGITAIVNDSVPLAGPRILVRAMDRLVLRIDAVHFATPERMRYQMSQDFGVTWAATDREILMNMAPAGEHDLCFRAQVPGSPWSDTMYVHLSVLPPWHQRTWFRVTAFVTLALVLLSVMRSRARIQDRRHRVQMDHQLAIQRERQRIASDMHDDIGADISHLLMMTRQFADSTTLSTSDRSNLSSIETATNGLLQKIDEVIWSLAPEDDNLHDALSYIQRYAEAFAEAHGMAFRTLPLPSLPSVALFAQDRRELYLMVKEVLHNITKHTSARSLRFMVTMADGMLRIRIEDDGMVLPSTGNGRNRRGRTNLRLRAERLGATLRSEMLTPVGTALTIELALPRNPDER